MSKDRKDTELDIGIKTLVPTTKDAYIEKKVSSKIN